MSTPDDVFYRNLYQHVGFALIAADTDLKIRVWNQAAARLFGASSERMIGAHLLEIVPAERRALVERVVRRVLRRGQTSEFEMPHHDFAGNPLSLAVTVGPIRDESGTRIGIAAAFRDITRRVLLEKQVVATRTMAALGSLSGSVAHHFNNLLGGIATSVDFALATSDPVVIRRALQATADSIARASRITRSLLTFAQGISQDDRQQENLDKIVWELLEEKRPRLTEHAIRLTFVERPIPALPVPAQHARTMLDNLVENAVDAMPNGGELLVELYATEKDILLVFQDTGVGIPPEDVERVFQPFFTTKGALGGGSGDHVGLGLAVVHGVVRELGGTISARSEPQRGTRFELRFPMPATR